jgi:hypothetical protein
MIECSNAFGLWTHTHRSAFSVVLSLVGWVKILKYGHWNFSLAQTVRSRLSQSRAEFFSYSVQTQRLFYEEVVALYYMAVTLHFLRNLYSNTSTNENLFRLSEQEYSASMLTFCKLLYIKIEIFFSNFAIKCKLQKKKSFLRVDLNVKFVRLSCVAGVLIFNF